MDRRRTRIDLRHERKIDVERLSHRRPLRQIELEFDRQLGLALARRLDHAGGLFRRGGPCLRRGYSADARRGGSAAGAAPESRWQAPAASIAQSSRTLALVIIFSPAILI